jgi:hypothetical protein
MRRKNVASKKIRLERKIDEGEYWQNTNILKWGNLPRSQTSIQTFFLCLPSSICFGSFVPMFPFYFFNLFMFPPSFVISVSLLSLFLSYFVINESMFEDVTYVISFKMKPSSEIVYPLFVLTEFILLAVSVWLEQISSAIKYWRQIEHCRELRHTVGGNFTYSNCQWGTGVFWRQVQGKEC